MWSLEYGERLPRRVEGVEFSARTHEDDRAGYPCLCQVMAVSGWLRQIDNVYWVSKQC